MSKQASIFTKDTLLSQLLRQKGVESVVDLAKQLGEYSETISDVVNGKPDRIFGVEPGTYQKPAQALADFLGVPPELLFDENPAWDELRRKAEEEFLAVTPTPEPADPLDQVIQDHLKETTTRVLASLTPREERVLKMRFGIGMDTDHVLEEVDQAFSVTRDRMRQIEAKALRKLKHPSRVRRLRSFLDTPIEE